MCVSTSLMYKGSPHLTSSGRLDHKASATPVAKLRSGDYGNTLLPVVHNKTVHSINRAFPHTVSRLVRRPWIMGMISQFSTPSARRARATGPWHSMSAKQNSHKRLYWNGTPQTETVLKSNTGHLVPNLVPPRTPQSQQVAHRLCKASSSFINVGVKLHLQHPHTTQMIRVSTFCPSGKRHQGTSS
jgi:hypothetical protein